MYREKKRVEEVEEVLVWVLVLSNSAKMYYIIVRLAREVWK